MKLFEVDIITLLFRVVDLELLIKILYNPQPNNNLLDENVRTLSIRINLYIKQINK